MGEENTFNVKANIIRADVTFSLQLPKLAFLFAEDTEFVGEWEVLGIQLSEDGIEEMETNYEMLEIEQIRSLIKPRKQFAHKGNFSKYTIDCRFKRNGRSTLFSLPTPASVRE